MFKGSNVQGRIARSDDFFASKLCALASLREIFRIFLRPLRSLRPMLRALDLIKPLGVLSQDGAFVGVRDRRFGDLFDLVQDIVGADLMGEIAGE